MPHYEDHNDVQLVYKNDYLSNIEIKEFLFEEFFAPTKRLYDFSGKRKSVFLWKKLWTCIWL